MAVTCPYNYRRPPSQKFGKIFPIMTTLVRAQRVLETAVATLLRPLFRLLLRQSMSFIAFEEIAKRVFVEVAMKDFGIEGKAPSMSRAAILSGLTRKEV